jgi:hypothetical protein
VRKATRARIDVLCGTSALVRRRLSKSLLAIFYFVAAIWFAYVHLIAAATSKGGVCIENLIPVGARRNHTIAAR